MQRRTLVLLAVTGFFILIIIALLASRVGGIAIRSAPTRIEQITLTVSDPAVRGSQVFVRWATPGGVPSQTVEFTFSDESGEQPLASASTADTQATITFPCRVNGTSGTLLMRNAANRQVLALERVTLLPPNHDCTQP